ncbi:hypothetical protein [Mesorhizobium loti]|uniref:hypothetical protein n=1 Tax=Rhizobium loti TaxID=381 RepID=UPI000403EFD0|nr:hypothetical protein [Mesorhizobium loti]
MGGLLMQRRPLAGSQRATDLAALLTAWRGPAAPQQTNQASALINVARNIGGSIGVSLSNTVIAQNAQLHQANLVSHAAQSSPAYEKVLHQVTEHFVAQGSTMLQAKQQAIGWIGQLIARQASLLAYVDVFRYCAIVTALFVPLALLSGLQSMTSAS